MLRSFQILLVCLLVYLPSNSQNPETIPYKIVTELFFLTHPTCEALLQLRHSQLQRVRELRGANCSDCGGGFHQSCLMRGLGRHLSRGSPRVNYELDIATENRNCSCLMPMFDE